MSSLKDLASLIMIPSLYKDGELHTVKPLADENIIVHPDATDNNDGVDGTTPSTSSNFTFSRGSNLAATRVDVNGLIEKGRENLLVQSNQLDTTWLIGGGGTGLTLTGGQVDRNGGNTAWLIDEVTNDQAIYQVVSTNNVQTFSIYAKAGTNNWMRLGLGGGSFSHAYFDLVNGTLGNTLNNIDSAIESAGNGWWRCSVSVNKSVNAVYVYPSEANNSGGTNGSIYIQDAQLEQGLVATDYIETGASTAQAGILEDMPRLDYSGGASCPSLLLEPSRTNVIPYSEYINGSGWTKSSGVVITDNAAQSPEGLNNASYVQFGAASKLIAISTSLSTGVSCSSSCYIKGTAGETIKIAAGGVDSSNITLTGEWQRIEHTATSINSSFNINTFGGVTARNVYIFGAMMEAGSYPTSYIPTYGSSVTRSQDAASLVGTDLLDQDNQTLFIEYTKGGEDGSANTIYSTSDGTSGNNRMQIVDNNDDVYLYSNAGGTNILNIANAILLTNLEKGDTIKVAVVMTTTSIKAFANGVEKVDFTNSFSWSVTMDDLYIGARGGSSEPSKGQGVKQALVFPTALTDSECIALTTL